MSQKNSSIPQDRLTAVLSTPSPRLKRSLEMAMGAPSGDADADDVLQEGRLKAIRSLSQGDAKQPNSPEAYYSRALFNIARSKGRRRIRERTILQSLRDRQITERERARQTRIVAAVREAVETLPPERRIIANRHLAGWTNRQIAEEYGVCLKTVSKWMCQIERQLRNYLQEFA